MSRKRDALLHGTLVVGSDKLCGVEQRAPLIFDRAAITMGIGPHSSFICVTVFADCCTASSTRIYLLTRAAILLGIELAPSSEEEEDDVILVCCAPLCVVRCFLMAYSKSGDK